MNSPNNFSFSQSIPRPPDHDPESLESQLALMNRYIATMEGRGGKWVDDLTTLKAIKQMIYRNIIFRDVSRDMHKEPKV